MSILEKAGLITSLTVNLQKVVFPDSLDNRVISACIELSKNKYCHPILLANPFELRSFCHQKGIKLEGIAVIDPNNLSASNYLSDFVTARMQSKPELSYENALAEMREPLNFAAMMLAKGHADYCIAGNTSSTSSVLRAGLRIIGLSEGNKTLSSVFFLINPNNNQILAFSDCAVIPDPTCDQLVDIAISTAANFKRLTNIEPKVAMLSFSTNGSAKHPLVDKVRAATEIIKQRAPNLIVDGDLQFDAAFVPDVAKQKFPSGAIKGDANVFIFPNLASGNIGYKIAQRLAGYAALGPLIQGLKSPMHDLSRGCDTQDIIDTTLLAIKMA